MASKKANEKAAQGWAAFDELVAARDQSNPWVNDGQGRRFIPDHSLLEELLAVPVRLGLNTQSGMPAKAVDVWVAHELRRAGFLPDEVWPRATAPRVLPREVALLRGAKNVVRESAALFKQIDQGKVREGITGADAKILGKQYEKQVDVVIAQWARGPELMVSTKRMDSSFSNNALNRIEESYGDAKNLRGRHPLAALGFLLVLRSTAFDDHEDVAIRLMDLVAKLAQEDDAYDATSVIVVEWQDLASGSVVTDDVAEGETRAVAVKVRHDLIQPELTPDRFMATMVNAVLDRTPIDLHSAARRRRGETVPSIEGITGAYDEDDELGTAEAMTAIDIASIAAAEAAREVKQGGDEPGERRI